MLGTCEVIDRVTKQSFITCGGPEMQLEACLQVVTPCWLYYNLRSRVGTLA